jgi:hypothetical protein
MIQHSKWVFFFLLLIPLQSFNNCHKFYFSLTEIKANTVKNSITISSKLFTDDFEAALLNKTNKKIDLTKSVNDTNVQKVVFNYLVQNLKMELNVKPLKFQFVGYEIENDVIWIYAESKLKDKEFTSLKIINSILYDFSTEQTNMIVFKWNENQYTNKLNFPAKEVFFSKQF